MSMAPNDAVVVLGAGLAGLAAGDELTRAGRSVTVLEAGEAVGGLSRTVGCDGFRYDLGGHRSMPSLVSGLSRPRASCSTTRASGYGPPPGHR